jgi:hypothetical protein
LTKVAGLRDAVTVAGGGRRGESGRRRFLRACGHAALAGAGSALAGGAWARPAGAPRAPAGLRPVLPDPARRLRGDSSVLAAWRQEPPGALAPPELRPPRPPAPTLAETFPDLKRHFVFEYYPWYGGPPRYEHWDQWDRVPPLDLGANHVPRLGAYDVRDVKVLEQHARWIADAGVGAVALSWWGQGRFEDRAAPLILDVMRDHDIKVTFAMEPYADERAQSFASDILYLLREYGEKRKWDAFLLLRDAAGRQGPVFKGFRCILPETFTDCRQVTRPVPDYTPDGVWRRQTDSLREALRGSFDQVTLLADSLEFRRTPASGFDGIGIYDNFIGPERYAAYAAGASAAGLVFSFNINPGFDSIEPRNVPRGACYEPQPFAPAAAGLDWNLADHRERAAQLSAERIAASWEATQAVQTDPALSNAARGFFLVYINSFNEWHEGHAFEPMKDAAELSPAERVLGYHNPERGGYRLEALARVLRPLTSAGATAVRPLV